MEEVRRSDAYIPEEPQDTVDELIWADTKRVERDRNDLFRFLVGRTDESYDDEPDRINPFKSPFKTGNRTRVKAVVTSLFTALALFASLLTVSELTHNSAEALIADGSCPGGGVIEPGETVYGIARNYGVNAERIIELNNLTDPDRIIAGQCLDLGLQSACNGHIVVKRETLTKISNRYGLTISEIVDLNGIPDPDQIKTGQCLLLADTGTATVAPQPVEVVIAPEPETVADPEVREVVDEIIEEMEATETIVEDVVEDVVAEIIADLPENLTLEEVVEISAEVQADVEEEIDQDVVDEVIEEVHEETPETLDEVQIMAVPTEVEESIEEAIVERVNEELEASLAKALKKQHEINEALAYIDALAVPDIGPVSIEQAREWKRTGGGPQMEMTDVARLLRWGGFCTYGVEELALALATVGGESNFKPYAVGDLDIQYQGDISIGFGQIYWSPGNGYTSDHRRPEHNIDPRNNVQTMFGMYQWRMDRFGWDNRFDDWYGHGPGVAKHMTAARQAVADIGGCE